MINVNSATHLKTIYRGDYMISLVFSSVMFIVFNVLIFSAYFYMNNKYKFQASLLKDLKKAIKILMYLDTIILMVLIYLFSIM